MATTGFLHLFLGLGLFWGQCDAACDASCQQQCSDQVQECMAPFQQLGSSMGNATGPFSMCADPASIPDSCKLYTDLATCLNEKLGQNCKESDLFKPTIDQSKASQDIYCAANVTCPTEMTKCMCNIMDSTNLFGAVCTGYSEFRTCLNNLPSKCEHLTMTQKMIELVKAAVGTYNYLMCPDAGGCPAAMTCLEQLAMNSSNPSEAAGGSQQDGPSQGMSSMFNELGSVFTSGIPNTNVDNACGELTVFDCLKTATSGCGIDQGDVTMDEIKTAYTEVCTDVLPKAASLGNCQSFRTCLETFEGIPDMSTLMSSSDGSPDGMNLPSSDFFKAIGHFMANTARTGFWCSWLKHNYRCAVDNAQDCSVSDEVVTLGNQKLSQLENTCIGGATAPPPKYDDQSGGAAIVVINLLPILTAVAVVLNIIL